MKMNLIFKDIVKTLSKDCVDEKAIIEIIEDLESEYYGSGCKDYPQIRKRYINLFDSILKLETELLSTLAIHGLQKLIKEGETSSESAQTIESNEPFPLTILALLARYLPKQINFSPQNQTLIIQVIYEIIKQYPRHFTPTKIINVFKLLTQTYGVTNDLKVKKVMRLKVHDIFAYFVRYLILTDTKMESADPGSDPDPSPAATKLISKELSLDKDGEFMNLSADRKTKVTRELGLTQIEKIILYLSDDCSYYALKISYSALPCVFEAFNGVFSQIPASLIFSEDVTNVIWKDICPAIMSIFSFTALDDSSPSSSSLPQTITGSGIFKISSIQRHLSSSSASNFRKSRRSLTPADQLSNVSYKVMGDPSETILLGTNNSISSSCKQKSSAKASLHVSINHGVFRDHHGGFRDHHGGFLGGRGVNKSSTKFQSVAMVPAFLRPEYSFAVYDLTYHLARICFSTSASTIFLSWQSLMHKMLSCTANFVSVELPKYQAVSAAPSSFSSLPVKSAGGNGSYHHKKFNTSSVNGRFYEKFNFLKSLPLSHAYVIKGLSCLFERLLYKLFESSTIFLNLTIGPGSNRLIDVSEETLRNSLDMTVIEMVFDFSRVCKDQDALNGTKIFSLNLELCGKFISLLRSITQQKQHFDDLHHLKSTLSFDDGDDNNNNNRHGGHLGIKEDDNTQKTMSSKLDNNHRNNEEFNHCADESFENDEYSFHSLSDPDEIECSGKIDSFQDRTRRDSTEKDDNFRSIETCEDATATYHSYSCSSPDLEIQDIFDFDEKEKSLPALDGPKVYVKSRNFIDKNTRDTTTVIESKNSSCLDNMPKETNLIKDSTHFDESCSTTSLIQEFLARFEFKCHHEWSKNVKSSIEMDMTLLRFCSEFYKDYKKTLKYVNLLEKRESDKRLLFDADFLYFACCQMLLLNLNLIQTRYYCDAKVTDEKVVLINNNTTSYSKEKFIDEFTKNIDCCAVLIYPDKWLSIIYDFILQTNLLGGGISFAVPPSALLHFVTDIKYYNSNLGDEDGDVQFQAHDHPYLREYQLLNLLPYSSVPETKDINRIAVCLVRLILSYKHRFSLAATKNNNNNQSITISTTSNISNKHVVNLDNSTDFANTLIYLLRLSSKSGISRNSWCLGDPTLSAKRGSVYVRNIEILHQLAMLCYHSGLYDPIVSILTILADKVSQLCESILALSLPPSKAQRMMASGSRSTTERPTINECHTEELLFDHQPFPAFLNLRNLPYYIYILYTCTSSVYIKIATMLPRAWTSVIRCFGVIVKLNALFDLPIQYLSPYLRDLLELLRDSTSKPDKCQNEPVDHHFTWNRINSSHPSDRDPYEQLCYSGFVKWSHSQNGIPEASTSTPSSTRTKHAKELLLEENLDVVDFSMTYRLIKTLKANIDRNLNDLFRALRLDPLLDFIQWITDYSTFVLEHVLIKDESLRQYELKIRSMGDSSVHGRRKRQNKGSDLVGGDDIQMFMLTDKPIYKVKRQLNLNLLKFTVDCTRDVLSTTIHIGRPVYHVARIWHGLVFPYYLKALQLGWQIGWDFVRTILVNNHTAVQAYVSNYSTGTDDELSLNSPSRTSDSSANFDDYDSEAGYRTHQSLYEFYQKFALTCIECGHFDTLPVPIPNDDGGTAIARQKECYSRAIIKILEQLAASTEPSHATAGDESSNPSPALMPRNKAAVNNLKTGWIAVFATLKLITPKNLQFSPIFFGPQSPYYYSNNVPLQYHDINYTVDTLNLIVSILNAYYGHLITRKNASSWHRAPYTTDLSCSLFFNLFPGTIKLLEKLICYTFTTFVPEEASLLLSKGEVQSSSNNSPLKRSIVDLIHQFTSYIQLFITETLYNETFLDSNDLKMLMPFKRVIQQQQHSVLELDTQHIALITDPKTLENLTPYPDTDELLKLYKVGNNSLKSILKEFFYQRINVAETDRDLLLTPKNTLLANFIFETIQIYHMIFKLVLIQPPPLLESEISLARFLIQDILRFRPGNTSTTTTSTCQQLTLGTDYINFLALPELQNFVLERYRDYSSCFGPSRYVTSYISVGGREERFDQLESIQTFLNSLLDDCLPQQADQTGNQLQRVLKMLIKEYPSLILADRQRVTHVINVSTLINPIWIIFLDLMLVHCPKTTRDTFKLIRRFFVILHEGSTGSTTASMSFDRKLNMITSLIPVCCKGLTLLASCFLPFTWDFVGTIKSNSLLRVELDVKSSCLLPLDESRHIFIPKNEFRFDRHNFLGELIELTDASNLSISTNPPTNVIDNVLSFHLTNETTNFRATVYTREIICAILSLRQLTRLIGELGLTYLNRSVLFSNGQFVKHDYAKHFINQDSSILVDRMTKILNLLTQIYEFTSAFDRRPGLKFLLRRSILAPNSEILPNLYKVNQLAYIYYGFLLIFTVIQIRSSESAHSRRLNSNSTDHALKKFGKMLKIFFESLVDFYNSIHKKRTNRQITIQQRVDNNEKKRVPICTEESKSREYTFASLFSDNKLPITCTDKKEGFVASFKSSQNTRTLRGISLSNYSSSTIIPDNEIADEKTAATNLDLLHFTELFRKYNLTDDYLFLIDQDTNLHELGWECTLQLFLQFLTSDGHDKLNDQELGFLKPYILPVLNKHALNFKNLISSSASYRSSVSSHQPDNILNVEPTEHESSNLSFNTNRNNLIEDDSEHDNIDENYTHFHQQITDITERFLALRRTLTNI